MKSKGKMIKKLKKAETVEISSNQEKKDKSVLSNLVKQPKGITLIALVVTIVVLIILAVVSISVIFGENGLITSAERGEVEHTHATVWERMEMSYSDYWAGKVAGEETSLIDYLQKAEIIAKTETNGGYKIDVEKLTGTKLSLGNGTEETDIYKLEPTKIEGASATKLASNKDTIKLAETNGEQTYKVMYYGEDESKNRKLGVLVDGSQVSVSEGGVEVTKRIKNQREKYAPGDIITYVITVNNKSDKKLNSVTVTDVLFAGNAETKRDEIIIEDIEAGKDKSIEYTYSVKKEDVGKVLKNTIEKIETDPQLPNIPKGEEIPPVPVTPQDECEVIHQLKVGDFVQLPYNEGAIECMVMYDDEYNEQNNTNYGIQMVTTSSLENVTLGKDEDFEKSVESYNNAIKTLNEEAGKYVNESNNMYVSSARCPGSIPDEPMSESPLELGEFVNLPDGYGDVYLKGEDTNYTSDCEQFKVMEEAGSQIFDDMFWLASRQEPYLSLVIGYTVRYWSYGFLSSTELVFKEWGDWR